MCLPGTIEAVREQTDREGVSRRALLAGGGAVAIAAAIPGTADAKRGRRRGHGHGHGGKGFGKITDLTHTFRAGFPVYTGDEPTRRTLKNYTPDGFYSQEWTFGEHSGTHMDAPGHFVEGNRRVDDLKPEELLAPAAVVDISSRAASDPDAEVTPDDLRRYERRHGRIPRGAIVFMNSGWAAKVNDNDAFKNADANGTYHFPGFGIEAVEFLLTRRKIQGSASTHSASTPATRPRSRSTRGCSAPTSTTGSRTSPTSRRYGPAARSSRSAWCRGRRAPAGPAACSPTGEVARSPAARL